MYVIFNHSQPPKGGEWLKNNEKLVQDFRNASSTLTKTYSIGKVGNPPPLGLSNPK
jgi:hypothetical protein